MNMTPNNTASLTEAPIPVKCKFQTKTNIVLQRYGGMSGR